MDKAKLILPTPDELFLAACAYCDKCISVISIRNDRGGHKRAACEWKQFVEQAAGVKELKRMFSLREITGVAVVLGPASGNLYGRDFDDKESYRRWATCHPDVAAILPSVETPRGFHVYFRSVEPVGTTSLGDGELRGGGAYMVLPPSLHPNGDRYRWVRGDLDECPTIDPQVAGLSQNWRCPPLHTKGTERAEWTECSEESERTEDTENAEAPEMTEGPQVVGAGDQGPSAIVLTIEQVIQRALPDGPHQNHEKLFVLARGARAIQGQEGQKWTRKDLRGRLFDPWYGQNQHLRVGQTRDEYWFEFLEAFDSVRVPLGDDVLARAWSAIEASDLPEEALQFESDQVRKLVAWTRELQRLAGEAPFFLACRSVQERLSLDHPKSASRMLRGLVKSGVLKEVAKGDNKRRKASRYRYLSQQSNQVLPRTD